MVKEVSRRGKSAYVTRTMFGKPKIVSGPTSGGVSRAVKVHNAKSGGLGVPTSSQPRKKSTGRLTGGSF